MKAALRQIRCASSALFNSALVDRKQRRHQIVPRKSERLLYCEHIERDGEALFRLACRHDPEGIVAKHKGAPYLPERQSTWTKIRNQNYSHWQGREELF